MGIRKGDGQMMLGSGAGQDLEEHRREEREGEK